MCWQAFLLQEVLSIVLNSYFTLKLYRPTVMEWESYSVLMSNNA